MDSDRLQQLETALCQGSVEQARLALNELAQYPSEQAIPLLQRVSHNSDVLRRRFAVMGLGNHRTDQAFAALQEIMERERDANVLGEVANSLYEFGEVALPLLRTMFLSNPNWLLRQSVLGILMDSDRDDLLLELAEVALSDDEQTVVETGILALGKVLKGAYHNQALALLIPLASDENWRNRWRTATALRLSPSAQARGVLIRLQHDENHYVVAQALEASLPE